MSTPARELPFKWWFVLIAVLLWIALFWLLNRLMA